MAQTLAPFTPVECDPKIICVNDVNVHDLAVTQHFRLHGAASIGERGPRGDVLGGPRF
jgi:hypothetical protein